MSTAPRQPQIYPSAGNRLRHSRWETRSESAFGLIEVMVALVVLLIAIVPLDWLVVSITFQAGQARAKVAATGVAEQWLEHYNTLPLSSFPANLPATVPEPTTTLGGTTYRTTVQLQWAESGLTGNLCTPGSTPQVVSAIADVTWGSPSSPTASSNHVQEQTVVNPPYGLLQPNSGFLALQVDGASGPLTTPVGQTTTATITPSPYVGGGASAAVTVPAGGCIFTSALNGSYTVSLSSTGTASPYLYVNQAESTTPQSVNLSVTGSATTSYVMTYDEGGAIALSYPSTSGLAGGTQCPTSTSCFAWGWSPNGTVDMIHDSPSAGFATLTLPAGTAAITGTSCETISNCYFTGIGPTGGLLLDDNGGSVSAVSLPVTATSMTSVACLNTTTCYAVGTDNDTGAVLVSIAGTAATNALPALTGEQSTLLSSIECSNSDNCIAVGSGLTVPTTGTGTPNALVLTTTGTNWTMSPIPAGPSAASNVACDTLAGGNPPICVAAIQSAGTTVMTSTNDGATWAVATSFPAGYTNVGPMVCTGATNCTVALQQLATTGTTGLTASTVNGTSWAVDAGWPSTFEAVTGLTCTSSTNCLASGMDSAGARVATNTSFSTTSAGAWSVASPGTASFFAGIGCLSSTSCLTAGGSDLGPVAFMTSDGGSTWAAPAAASGFANLTWTPAPAQGLPITVANGLLPGNQMDQVVSAEGASNSTLIPNLFPFTSTSSQPDYEVWAGDATCPNELPPAADRVPIPVTSGVTSSATVPLTLLPIAAVRPNGTPIVSAGVAVTVATSGCPPDTLAVPGTSAAGLVEVGIPTSVVVGGLPMTYTVKVTAGTVTSTATLAVNATGITVQGTSITYPFPTPVPFVLNVP